MVGWAYMLARQGALEDVGSPMHGLYPPPSGDYIGFRDTYRSHDREQGLYPHLRASIKAHHSPTQPPSPLRNP